MVSRTSLVTGAGGFIGSHLTERLLTLGGKVRALVSYRGDGSAGWLDSEEINGHPNLEVVRGDIRDPHQMMALVEGVDAVFNLAALIGIPYSFEAPMSYVSTNVVGTQNLLEAAKHHNVRAFIQTSTSEVYGTAQFVPMPETHPINPQSPYAASKVASDALATSYFHSFDMPVAVLRPFNTFGPRQSARAVIPTILTQLLDSESEGVRLGNLNARRDFTYVADTVSGFVKSSDEIEKCAGRTLNLGAGWDIQVEELAELCARVLGKSLTIVGDERRLRPNTSEVESLMSDNSLARETIGWHPVDSSPEIFDEHIERTADWIRVKQAEGKYVINGYRR